MLCFSMICGSAGSKSNLVKAGAEGAVEKIARRCSEKHIFKSKCTKHTRFGPLLDARRCSEKHIFNSKCTKHCRFGPLFEVAMWKNCTPL